MEFFKELDGEKPDEVEVAKHKAAVLNSLDVYEKVLANSKFLTGDELSLADLFHLPFGIYAIIPEFLENRPNVSRWWSALTNLPSWVKVTAEGGRFPVNVR